MPTHEDSTSLPAAAARANPCSRSQIRSSTDSVPTESRIVPGPRRRPSTPPRSAGDGLCWPGWMIRLFESPTLARCDKSVTPRMNFLPSSRTCPCSRRRTPRRGRGADICPRRPGSAGQSGIGDLRGDLCVSRYARLPGVVDMAIHAQGQCFESLQDEERIHRRDARAEIAHRFGAHLHQVAVWSERIVKRVGRDRPATDPR